MNDSQMYIDFIEGNLDSDSERQFAAQFAIDEEFRSGFKSYLLITGSINSNIKSFGPSTIETNELYSKLGYTIPTSVPFKQVPAKSYNTVLNSQLFKILATGIGSAVIGVIFTLMFLNAGNVETKSVSPKKINNQNQLAKIESRETGASPNQVHVKPLVKYIYIKDNKLEKADINKNENLALNSNTDKTPSIHVQSIKPAGIELYDIKPKVNKLTLLPGLSEIFAEEAVNGAVDRKTRFSLEYRNSLNWNIPKETVSPAGFNKFNNMEIALLYNIIDGLKIGAEIKQETFYEEYTGSESDGKLYNYYQQSNYTTYSGIIRYSIFETGIIAPYLQFSAGWNRGGYVIKPALGLECCFLDNFSIILGTEYDIFRFRHLDKQFSTKKAVLNYGISYKF